MTIRRALVAAVLGFAMLSAGAALAAELLLFGGAGHHDFLGCLTCGEFDASSVSNQLSPHGFSNKFATWNPFGPYASPYSTYSACSLYATDPPVIVDRAGGFYGRFSLNPYVAGSVCGVNGHSGACSLVKALCEQS